jgi:hypothetical protein
MKFIKKYKLNIIGVITGAIGGYLYYYFVGCATGTCPITSKPFNSSLYGAIMGGLIVDLFKKEKTKT